MPKINIKQEENMENRTETPVHTTKEAQAENRPPNPWPRRLYMLFLSIVVGVTLQQPAFATSSGTATIWTKATEILQDVYSQILLISTIAAVVTASIALLMMNFSKSGRTVDESRAWLKRICITWAILNGLGFIMAYITPFFAGGQWTA